MKKRVLAALLAVCLLIGTGVTFALAKDGPDTYAEEGKYYDLDAVLGGKDLQGQKYQFLKDNEIFFPGNPCTAYSIKPNEHNAMKEAIITAPLSVTKIDKYNVDTYLDINAPLKKAIDSGDVIVTTTDSKPDSITINFSVKNDVKRRLSYAYYIKKTLKDVEEDVKDPTTGQVAGKKVVDKSQEEIKDSDYEKIPLYGFTYTTTLSPVQTTAAEIEITLKRAPEITTYALEGEDFKDDLAGLTYFRVADEATKITYSSNYNGVKYYIAPKAVDNSGKPAINRNVDVSKINKENVGNYLIVPDSEKIATDDTVEVKAKDNGTNVQITFTITDQKSVNKVYTLLKDLKDTSGAGSDANTPVVNTDYKEVPGRRFVYEEVDKNGNKISEQQGSSITITLQKADEAYKASATTYGKKDDVFTMDADLKNKKYIDVLTLKNSTDPNEKKKVVNPDAIINNKYTITPKAEAFAIESDVLMINKDNVNHYFNLSANLQQAIKDDLVFVMGVFGPYDKIVNVTFTLNPKAEKAKNSKSFYRLAKDLTDEFDSTNKVYIDQSNKYLEEDKDPNDVDDKGVKIVKDYEIINIYNYTVKDEKGNPQTRLATYEFDRNDVDSNGKWTMSRHYDSVTYTVHGVSRNPQRDPSPDVKVKWNLWKNLKDLGNWIKGAFTFLLRTAWEPFRWVLSYIVDIEPIF
jgi:hypothetical protein